MMDGPSEPVVPPVQTKIQSNNNNNFIDDIVFNNNQGTSSKQPNNNNDMFGLLDINMGSSTSTTTSNQTGLFGGDLLGFGN